MSSKMDDCQRHQEQIAMMVSGLCSETDKQLVEKHLNGCASCRKYFQELTAVAADILRLKTWSEQSSPNGQLRARWTMPILDGPPSSDANKH